MVDINESFTGNHLRFLPDKVPEDEKKRAVYYVLSLICDDWQGNWQELMGASTLKAIFLKESPELMGVMRSSLKAGFLHLFCQLRQMEMTPETLLQAQIYIRNCMSFIPYTVPKEGDTFSFPQWIDNQWQFVQYRVEPIELTNWRPNGSFFQQKRDRFYAYGFVPVVDKRANSQLVFMASSYPAGTGFWMAVKTDMKSHTTAGESLYLQGRARLSQWLDEQGGKVDAGGISLGGTLALLLAIDQGEKLASVHAYKPAGLYPYKRFPYDNWQQLENKPDVRVVTQGRDVASKLGIYKRDWRIIHLKPAKKRRFAYLLDHAFSFANNEDTQFSEVDPKQQNRRNRHYNSVLYGAGRSFLYFTVVTPYHYVARPIIYGAANLVSQLGKSS